jgi:hypothetical protein
LADIDLRSYTIGTGGAPALDDVNPACWSPNILSDGDATTGEVGKFFDLKNAGTSVSQMTKIGALALAGMLSIGATLFGATSVGLKNSSATMQVVLADESALTGLEAKSLIATGGTVTATAPLFNATQTWNAVGTAFTAIKVNITNTTSAAASLFLDLQLGGSTYFSIGKDAYITSLGGALLGGNQCYIRATTSVTNGAIWLPGGNSSSFFGFTTNTTASSSSTISSMIHRTAAGVIGIRGATSTTGGVLNLLEQTAPSAPSANQVNIYAVDNGAGKTQLMALFQSGAAQQIAIEP